MPSSDPVMRQGIPSTRARRYIVIQVTPSPSKAGAAVLPQTGGDASALPFVVGGAVALLLAGAVLLFARRRTRR